jgi:hypothetical protein
MLEILFLVWFVRKLSAMAKAKGRSGGWGGLGAAMWIGGEIVGVIVGGIADAGAGAYLLALLFAGIGAVISYVIVSSLKSEASRYDGVGTVPAGYAPSQDPSNPYAAPRGY